MAILAQEIQRTTGRLNTKK